MFRQVCMCIAVLLWLAVIFMAGRSYEKKKWERWCLENEYAYYNDKTGELILRDQEYWNNLYEKLKDNELFQDFLPKFEEKTDELARLRKYGSFLG